VNDDYQTPLSPGDRLDRYELICPIASGGMASVWVARMKGKHGFEKLVAIKTILPQYASDTRFRAMFLDEASILSQIQHANVAQILDVGEEREVLYLVMEFVDGDSLSKLLKTILTKRLEIPIGVVLRILADASVGLHAAHELKNKNTGAPIGLVHRDVSPQNILITQTGATKLIDFGIAKAQGRLTQETSAGAIKGKIAYMAPEQAQGKGVDRRADVWAIGAILYALYAHRTPYEGETELDTLHSLVVGKDPVPLGAEVPAPVREIAAKATRCSPEERFRTASELARALEGAMSALGVPTSSADVAAFMATHMQERAASRQKALAYALKAAADRERVRQMLSPELEDQISSDAFGGAHKRMVAANLDDSVPPPAPGSSDRRGAGAAGSGSGSQARVRVGGTMAYEDANLGHAHTQFKSNMPAAPTAPPPVSRPVATKIAELGAAPPLSVKPKGQSPSPPPPPPPEDVPDLIVPSETRKPKPQYLEPPPPSPFDMEDEDPGFVAPPPRIASAAGSILGPDVLGPDAGKAPPPPSIAPPAPPPGPHRQTAKATGEDAPTSGDFFDPMAIAAQRAAEPRRDSNIALSHRGGPGGEMMGASRPVRAIVVDTQAELKRAREENAARPRSKWMVIAPAVLVVLALVGGGIVAAPSYARSQAIAAAGQQGITLTVERATVGWGTAHLYGLTMAAADFPNVKMNAASAVLDLRGFDAETVTVQDPNVTATGPTDDVQAMLGKLADRVSTGAPKTKKLQLQNVRVTWTGPLGDGSRVDGEGIGLELVRGTNLGDEAHFTAPSVRITTSRGVLGPWRLDADRASKQTRLRIGFDPVLADGPSAIFVRTEGGTTATIKITRQPLTRLGIPHAFLGLVVDETTQAEAAIQVTRPLPTRVVGDGQITIFDARITPQSPKLDLGLKGSFAGEPGKPLDTVRTQLSFGPLIANVVGAVTLQDEYFRAELKWAVLPLPCGVLTKKTSPAQASAAGLVTFDSRHPDQADFKLTQASTCGLPIFPSL
jgi:eukaryotic-like serine/threonine-protein kinase